MQRIHELIVFACVSAFVALGATPVAAQPTPWDQAQVTAVAKQLAAATEAWELAIRQQPGGEVVGSGDAQDEFSMVHKARVLNEMGGSLAAHLGEGQGYDKTRDLYRSMKEVVDDTQVKTQEAELDLPASNAWAKVTGAMGQLAPYYAPKEKAD
jgi:hypothetical protein